MAILVDGLLKKVSIICHDESRVRWKTEELLLWLNEALVALVVKFPEANTKRFPGFRLAPGAKQTLPEEVISLFDMTGVPSADIQTLDAFSLNWRQRPTASVVRNFLYRPEEYPTFWVWPAQNDKPAQVELVCSCKPAKAVSGGTLDVQDKYEDRLVNYVLYRALSKDAEVGSVERATAYYQLFNA